MTEQRLANTFFGFAMAFFVADVIVPSTVLSICALAFTVPATYLFFKLGMKENDS